MRILYQYLFKFKTLSGARILTNVCKAACTVYLSIILGNVLDGLANSDVSMLTAAVLRCVVLLFFFVIVSGLDIWVTTLQTKKILNYIKHDIFSKIISGSIEKYRSMHSGKYLSILNNDISTINEEFITNFFDLIFQILSFAISLVIMLRINIVVTGIILGISMLSMYVVSKISDKLMRQQVKLSESLENVTKLAADIFSGILVIKNYNLTSKIEEMYYSNDQAVEDNRKKYSIMIGGINILMVCFSMLIYLTIVVFCATSVMNATLSAGTALIILQLSSNLTEPINEIISIGSAMNSVKGIGEKIQKIYMESGDETGTIHKDVFNKSINIHGLEFGYNPEDNLVLNGVDLEFCKGKKYAIVGESGSGKTTLIKLLLKYYNKYSGKILIDETDIRTIDINDYCSLISSMEQDTFIFDETLWDNICLYSDYTEQEVKKAVLQAGLTSVVERLPDGLQTMLGEGGSNLSGGECQRVAFARLLLKKTPILLLDEATANLDNEMAVKIERLVLENKNLTLVSITHKLIKQVLQQYDEIIVLKKGIVIEKGSFNQLMQKQGYFFNLYNVQTMEA